MIFTPPHQPVVRERQEYRAAAATPTKLQKLATLLELPPTPPPRSQSTSEGKPGADPPVWVFERSPEGESEIPRGSEGRDAEANARWGSTGLPERTHRLWVGRSLVAGLFRRGLMRRPRHLQSGEKLERSSSSHRPLRLTGKNRFSERMRSFGTRRAHESRSVHSNTKTRRSW